MWQALHGHVDKKEHMVRSTVDSSQCMQWTVRMQSA